MAGGIDDDRAAALPAAALLHDLLARAPRRAAAACRAEGGARPYSIPPKGAHAIDINTTAMVQKTKSLLESPASPRHKRELRILYQ